MLKPQLHRSARVRCPECETKSLRPVVDQSKPDGVDTSKGYCYYCSKHVGATGPKHRTREQRSAELLKYHTLSTDGNVQMRNGLASLLVSRYGDAAVQHLQAWDVGTDGIGNCVYWYRDVDGELQTGKIVPYDSETGKRRKGADSPICWTKDGKEQRVDVLFGIVEGRHPDGSLAIVSLSSNQGYSRPLYGAQFVGMTAADVPVLLVEAEKTAVVASLFVPFVVVATGGASGLTSKSAAVLAGRDVYVLLDADDTGRNATAKAADVLLSVGARPVVEVDGVSLVDYLMPDVPKGYDLADYYLSLQDVVPTVTLASVEALTAPLDTGADLLASVEALTAPLDVDTVQQLTQGAKATTAETPQLSESQRAELYANVDGVRSALLRAFGNDEAVQLDELYERVRSRRIAGGREVVGAAQYHKLLRLSWDTKARTYSAVLTERG